MTARILRLIYFAGTSLMVIAPALYNRYPLVYFDSGAYMEMAVSLEPSYHRSIGYPLLIKLSGWTISNWPVILLQGALVSLLLFRLMHLLFPVNARRYHFLSVLLLGFFTSMSWYASQLMPDIFSFILVLSLLLVIIERKLTLRLAFGYGTLMFIAGITHLSHIPLILLMLIAIGVVQWRSPATLSLPRANWMVLAGSLLASWLFIASYNAAHHRGFGLGKASNVFITANIGEMGFLKLYLDENCETRSSSLCQMKDSLPLETGGYLWDVNGPVQKHPGGWEGANEEYAPIVRDFLTKPRYLKWFLFGAIKATFKQLFQIELGSGLQYRYGHGTPPFWPMQEHYKQELNEYLTSIQNKKDELPISFFRWMNYIGLFVSVGILGWMLLSKTLPHRITLLILMSAIFYLFHAATTGILANVYDRLQCRVLPVAALMALLAVFHAVEQGRSRPLVMADESD